MAKKNSSIKGLILVMIVLAIVGSYFIITMTHNNMKIQISVWDSEKPLAGAVVSYGSKQWLTQPDGTIFIETRVDQGEKIIFTAEKGAYSTSSDTLSINQIRYRTGFANLDIVLKDK